MKRVLFVIIDALTSRVVGPAIDEGRLPTFAKLRDAGVYRESCYSIFPSITPAATAALVTGHYPSVTGITGASWYDRERDEAVYYGDDLWAIWNQGTVEYIHGFLTRLNYERLKCPTIYELADEADLTSSCFNLMWFRGPHRHSLHKPLLLDAVTFGEMPNELAGPNRLLLGDFVHAICDDKDHSPKQAGLTGKYGFRDETTAEALLAAAETGNLANVNVAYFPINDFRSHEVGPFAALPVVEEVDRVLGEFIERLGGLDKFVSEWAIAITGDHSHSDTAIAEDRSIELAELLDEFRPAPTGADWTDDYDMVIGANMRATNFYFRDAAKQRPDAIRKLLSEPRIDQAIWQSDGKIHVATEDRGRLSFWTSSDGVADEFGGRWEWSGDLSAIDVEVDGDKFVFGDYPNAFERLTHGLHDKSGDLWVTSRPGFEFKLPCTETHEGGSHGSLHRLDSVAPLIAAGFPEDAIPPVMRVVDLLPLLATVTSLKWTEPGVGQSRA